jgi:tellurite methyltransferase
VSERWTRYYDAAGEEPRETLVHALSLFEADGMAAGFAVDLGCGTGRDTVELLRRGWSVLAVDAEPEAIERLRRRPEAASAGGRLRTDVARFEAASWLEADLVSSSFALPFCPPAAFHGLWARIVSSLRPGGRFAGQLFGDRDEWAGDDGTFLTRDEVERLLRPFHVERGDEVEQDGQTAVGDAKHWHFFAIVARKR